MSWALTLARPIVLPLADRLTAERGRLAPWLAVALGGGVLLYFTASTEPDPAWRWLPIPLLLLALCLARRAAIWAWVVGLAAALALGFAVAGWHAARQPAPLIPPRGATVLEGVVASVDLLPEGQRLTLAMPRFDGGEPAPRSVRVRLRTNDPARPAPGDRVRVRARVMAPASPAFPGAWDFQRAAYFSGLGGSGYALGPADIVARDAAPNLFAALRATIEARVAAALPGDVGAISGALLTGGQSAIPKPALEAMRDSGLAHLLSPSGLHIAIVMGLTFWLVRLLLAAVPPIALRWPAKALAAGAALVVGTGYLLLTDSLVPMQRSLGMAALASLALLAGRRALTLRAWAIAAAVVLLVQPAAILGPSFQMSFAAVLALIAGWEWMRPRVDAAAGPSGWSRRLRLVLFGVAATSVLAGAATTPFGLHHFGRLQLYGVAANALAVPLTSFWVMPAGMAAAALMPLGWETPALTVMGWGVEATLWVARTVAGWPGSSLSLRPIPSWGLGLCAAGLLWLGLWRTGWRLAGVPLLLAGMASDQAVRPPDLLVSADARLIGFHAEGAVALTRLTRAPDFTRDMWLRAWAVPEGFPLPTAGAALGAALMCDRAACRFRPRADAPVAVLLRSGPPAEACAGAAVAVSAEPIRGRCGAQVIDRFTVWRNGAHAIWLDPAGVRVLSDRAWRGERPWVPPVPQPRGTAAPEPPAATE